MWLPFRRRGRNIFRLQSVTVKIPYVGDFQFLPDESETRVAWAIYVELATRVPIEPLDVVHGSRSEALGSIYALFQAMRVIIREAGPQIARRSDSLAFLAIGVLNSGLRPFLTKWHSELEVHEAEQRCSEGARERGRVWDHAPSFDAELKVLGENLSAYAQELLKIAGAHVEDNHAGREQA